MSTFSKRFPKLSAALFGTPEPGSESLPETSAHGQQQWQQQQQQQQRAPAPAPAPARPVSIEDLRSAQPLVAEAPLRDGGTQGLKWVEQTLRTDEDGDKAHGFISIER